LCKQKAKLEELSVWRVVNKLPAFLKTKPWPAGNYEQESEIMQTQRKKNGMQAKQGS
jgi:hypothetical protein